MTFTITMLQQQKILAAPSKSAAWTGRVIGADAIFESSNKIGDYFSHPTGGWVCRWKGGTLALSFVETGTPPPEELPSERIPVITYRLGIIKMRTGPLERTNDPQTLAMMDYPQGSNKGHTINILQETYDYLKKIQTPKAHWWLFHPKNAMTNKRHKWDGMLPPVNDPCVFENLGLPCNYIAMSEFTSTHARVVSKLNTANMSQLNPVYDNWYHKPTEYWMLSMRNAEGRVFKVGNALDVYTMVIRQLPGLWIPLSDVEQFPSLPMVVTYQKQEYLIDGYCLRGVETYGHTADKDIPLRIMGQNGIEHPCPEWRLNTKPLPI